MVLARRAFLEGSCTKYDALANYMRLYADDYQCGIQLSQLGKLEQEGISEYAKIPSFCQERGYIQSFHTPSGTFEATSTLLCIFLAPSYAHIRHAASQTPDVALWVVDASDEVNWLSSAQSLAALLADGKLRPTQRLLIVINKM